MSEEKPKRRGNPNWVKGMKRLPGAGRPKGSVSKYTELSRQMMTEKGPLIVKKVMDMAMDGDVHCLKMCIDRILPVHKAVDPNRAKQDSQIVINVGASDTIQEKITQVDPNELIDPPTKDEEQVIIDVVESK